MKLSDEDMEVEIVEEEPPFLQGHGRHWVDLSPVKIVKVTWDFLLGEFFTSAWLLLHEGFNYLASSGSFTPTNITAIV